MIKELPDLTKKMVEIVMDDGYVVGPCHYFNINSENTIGIENSDGNVVLLNRRYIRSVIFVDGDGK